LKKSKFIVFLLSFFPGLGHIYLGCFSRGYIFMGAVAAGIILILGLCFLSRSESPLILLLGYPLLWFVALVDSLALTDMVNQSSLSATAAETTPASGADHEKMAMQNRKIIACLLSVVPGAGHMYLGYQKLGLEIMTLFFFTLFFIDWIRISLFIFILPVIWCYSMFDALHKASGSEAVNESDLSLFTLFNCQKIGAKVLGYVLIGLGLLLIFERVILSIIPYTIRHYLQTIFVALLLIAGGVRLLTGQPATKRETNGEVRECEGGE